MKTKLFLDDTVLICKLLPPFRNDVIYPFLWSNHSGTQYKDMFYVRLTYSEEGSTKIFRNCGNYLPIDVGSCTMRLN